MDKAPQQFASNEPDEAPAEPSKDGHWLVPSNLTAEPSAMPDASANFSAGSSEFSYQPTWTKNETPAAMAMSHQKALGVRNRLKREMLLQMYAAYLKRRKRRRAYFAATLVLCAVMGLGAYGALKNRPDMLRKGMQISHLLKTKIIQFAKSR